MKKFKTIIKITGLLVFGVALFLFLTKNPEDTSQNEDTSRYDNANSDQKACVKTFGEGVYKDKSLEWKLDNCNVPK